MGQEEFRILLHEISPHGNLEAIVDQDERVAFLYMRSIADPKFGTRCCWLRNLRPAPRDLDASGMQKGISPMLPREFCRHPQGEPPLTAQDLRVVWLPEGDGVALLHRGELMALIPAWSGMQGFHGYAAACAGQSPLCWGLDEAAERLGARIDAAREYWASWERGDSPWSTYQPEALRRLEHAFGAHSHYYAIDGTQWPPKGLVRFNRADATVLVTIGVAVRPQPRVEMVTERPELLRRFELAMALAPSLSQSAAMRCISYISGETNRPWRSFTFLADGHTIPCDALPAGGDRQVFPAALLCSHPPGAPRIELPAVGGEPVNLLWALPITERERALAVDGTSSELIARLAGRGYGWIHAPRSSVAP